MASKNILLIGGSGFLGSRVAGRLAARGHRLTVPTRHRERARRLLVLPTVEVLETDVHDDACLAGLVAGKDAVINLVGILHGRHGLPYGPDFARAHVELPKRIAAACRAAGVRRLIHVSALNADPKGPSQYLRSKGEGEAVLRAAGAALELTIFRPSVVFGPEDAFLNLFAALQRRFPLMPLGNPQAKFQPVHVEDVAQAIVASLDRRDSIGQAYGCCGPKVYTLAELVRYVGEQIGRPRPILALPEALARLQAGLLELLPNPPLSVDNLDSMDVDSVCAGGEPLPFGIRPVALEAVAPEYLGGRTPRHRFYGYRLKAHRSD
ncbi:MAG: NADH dehydrogenase [Candidatus Desulfobacillus denitrificans]|jgi:NADH dehydrogenase|uniref:NADH dehydrogenase (Ubiquinone) 1 alpha subcomplex, subunit 9 n=1 Tax=Candidatus Desulfobacillus denitrificans TaxID=2608985 RepID=A0A809S7K1_9PROT|nr:complex I NDUFA9 subunit family protein [Rhodocyclaceae bacterium]BBO22331.1 NADH dehydrogenase (ubiquinone) 1 alpha subcomplex, subunit 9 [Candidatus Desulfobacillus denitrificans]GIK45540.1 MAG: NAD-dependent dehydratase [Betaproteobacteria bacterium]GJQ54480.1 MAG: NAD-dependent dehydratase [Rhodocyclaceae bacterium]